MSGSDSDKSLSQSDSLHGAHHFRYNEVEKTVVIHLGQKGFLYASRSEYRTFPPFQPTAAK